MEPTRREIVQMLAALGLAGAATSELAAQAPQALSASDMKGALAIQGRDMPDGEIALIQRALERNLDEFGPIRELEMSDDVALPIVFSVKRA